MAAARARWAPLWADHINYAKQQSEAGGSSIVLQEINSWLMAFTDHSLQSAVVTTRGGQVEFKMEAGGREH